MLFKVKFINLLYFFCFFFISFVYLLPNTFIFYIIILNVILYNFVKLYIKRNIIAEKEYIFTAFFHLKPFFYNHFKNPIPQMRTLVRSFIIFHFEDPFSGLVGYNYFEQAVLSYFDNSAFGISLSIIAISFIIFFIIKKTNLLEKISTFFNSFSFIKFYRDELTDSIMVSSLILIIYKLIFYFILFQYSPWYLNIFILSIFTFFSYYFNLILILKKLVFFYVICLFLPDNSVARVVYDFAPDDEVEEAYYKKIIQEFHEKKNPFRIFEAVYNMFILIRLFSLSEPYFFLLFRILLFYFLIFNGFYFFAIFLTFIILSSRLLFHFSDFDHECIKYFYQDLLERENLVEGALKVDFEAFSEEGKTADEINLHYQQVRNLSWSLINNFKDYDSNYGLIIKPTWHNAKIMYYYSLRNFFTKNKAKADDKEMDFAMYLYRYEKRYRERNALEKEIEDSRKILHLPLYVIHGNSIAYLMNNILRNTMLNCTHGLILQYKKNIYFQLFFTIIFSLLVLFLLNYLCVFSSQDNAFFLGGENFLIKSISKFYTKKNSMVFINVKTKEGKMPITPYQNLPKNISFDQPSEIITISDNNNLKLKLGFSTDMHKHPIDYFFLPNGDIGFYSRTTFENVKAFPQLNKTIIEWNSSFKSLEACPNSAFLLKKDSAKWDIFIKFLKEDAYEIKRTSILNTHFHLKDVDFYENLIKHQSHKDFIQKLDDIFLKHGQSYSPNIPILREFNNLLLDLTYNESCKVESKSFLLEMSILLKNNKDCTNVNNTFITKVGELLKNYDASSIDKNFNLSSQILNDSLLQAREVILNYEENKITKKDKMDELYTKNNITATKTEIFHSQTKEPLEIEIIPGLLAEDIINKQKKEFLLYDHLKKEERNIIVKEDLVDKLKTTKGIREQKNNEKIKKINDNSIDDID